MNDRDSPEAQGHSPGLIGFAVAGRAAVRTRPNSPPAEVPRAPALLTTDKLQRAYRRLWRSCAVANVWRAEDAHAVARLVLLRDRIAREGDDAKRLSTRPCSRSSKTLRLSPRARRASGVTVDEHTLATLHVLPGGELEQVRAALAEHEAAPR